MLTKTQEQTIRDEFNKKFTKKSTWTHDFDTLNTENPDRIFDWFINKTNTLLEEQKKELMDKFTNASYIGENNFDRMLTLDDIQEIVHLNKKVSMGNPEKGYSDTIIKC